MPKYPGISPYDNEKGDLGSAKKRWNKIFVKEIESDTVSGINATIENLATTAENSVANAVAAKNAAVDAKAAAETAAETAATAAAGIQSVVETDVDNTLSISGVAADAKVTGDWLRDIAKPVTLDTSLPATAYADEYMKVTTDSEGRVLYGVKRDGSFTWQKGVPKHLQDKISELAAPTIDNDEYMYVMLDADNHILFGVKKDGSFDWQKGVPKPVREKFEEFAQTVTDSKEFVQLTQDAEGKIIEGIRGDGTKVIYANTIFKGNVGLPVVEKLLYPYNVLKGKKVSIIGDSCSTYRGVTDQYWELSPYPGYDVTSVADTWWQRTINHFEMQLLNNCSISGSRVCGDSTISSLDSSPSRTPGCCDYRIAQLAKDGIAPDIVLIYIGVNDFAWDTLTISTINPGDEVVAEGVINDFAKAYDLMLYKIKTTYPNAKVYCATLPYFKRGQTVFPYVLYGNSYTMGNEAIRQACKHIGAFVIENYCNEFDGQTVSNTDVHPALKGMLMLSRAFINKLFETN